MLTFFEVYIGENNFAPELTGMSCKIMELVKLSVLLTFFIVRLHIWADVVVDAETLEAIGGVSVFDKNNNLIGVTDAKGKLPTLTPTSLPLTLRCIGYREATITNTADSLMLMPITYALPELKVVDKENKALHLLAYVREYSTLTTYTDTVDMYREKWCDFMLPSNKNSKFKGWLVPRTLNSKSYYHFSDCYGLDSVSDRFNNHFTWSDWVGVNRSMTVPAQINENETASHEVAGKYGNVVKWHRTNDKIRVEVDALADTSGRRWIPGLSRFFEQGVEFDLLKLDYRYEDFVGKEIEARDLQGFSINVESRGRGRDMFKFNHVDQPFFVTTYAEVFIVDKEVLSVKEAKRWQKMSFSDIDFDGFLTVDIPEVSEETGRLIARVNSIDHISKKLKIKPDPILVGIDVTKKRKSGLLKRLRSIRQSVYVRMAKMNDSKIKKARERHEKLERMKRYEEQSAKEARSEYLDDRKLYE